MSPQTPEANDPQANELHSTENPLTVPVTVVGLEEMSPDIRAIVDAWPDLPEAIKAGILAIVKAASDANR